MLHVVVMSIPSTHAKIWSVMQSGHQTRHPNLIIRKVTSTTGIVNPFNLNITVNLLHVVTFELKS